MSLTSPNTGLYPSWYFALLQPLQNGNFCHFSKSCHYSNIKRFFKPFFAQNICKVSRESFKHVFGTFKFSPRIDHFALLQHLKMATLAIFRNPVISRILGVFSSGFLHRTFPMCLWSHLKHVFGCFKFSPRINPNINSNPEAKFPIIRKVKRVKRTKSNLYIVVNKRNLWIERIEKRQNAGKNSTFFKSAKNCHVWEFAKSLIRQTGQFYG